MKRLLALTSIVMNLILSASQAFAQLEDAQNDLAPPVTPVHVECAFSQTTKITCADFIRGFFADTQSVIVQENNLDKASINLTLFDDADTGALTKYTFSWKSKDHIQVSDFEYYYNVDQTTQDADQLRDSLLRRAAAGVTMYLDVIRIKADDGVLSGSYQTPKNGVDAGEDGLFARLQKSPLYFNFGLDGSFRTTGQAPYVNSSLSVNPDMNVVYLKDRYKIDILGYYKNTKTSVPSSSGGTLTGETQSKYVNAIFVYTMKRRWSVAVIENYGSDTAANTHRFNNTTAGLEWALVPFRTNQNQELSFRVGATNSVIDLDNANERGNLSERYMTAFARIYSYWNFMDNRATLRLSTGVETNLKYKGYQKYNFGATMTFQLNRSTKLSFNGYYNYLTKSLTYPGVPDYSNPLLVQQMTGQAGRSLYSSVSLDITIGNSLKKSRDRRWAGDPAGH